MAHEGRRRGGPRAHFWGATLRSAPVTKSRARTESGRPGRAGLPATRRSWASTLQDADGHACKVPATTAHFLPPGLASPLRACFLTRDGGWRPRPWVDVGRNDADGVTRVEVLAQQPAHGDGAHREPGACFLPRNGRREPTTRSWREDGPATPPPGPAPPSGSLSRARACSLPLPVSGRRREPPGQPRSVRRLPTFGDRRRAGGVRTCARRAGAAPRTARAQRERTHGSGSSPAASVPASVSVVRLLTEIARDGAQPLTQKGRR